MFVYSLRASTLKFFAVVCVTLTAIIMMVAFIPGGGDEFLAAGSEKEISYEKIKTNDDRVNFLSQFGWQVNSEPIEVTNITIPKEFDKIFTGYNEIQKRQGLDLSKYKNKDVTRYTYEVTNYAGETSKVYANVIVYRNKVIGGDICSADVKGFIHGFEKPD